MLPKPRTAAAVRIIWCVLLAFLGILGLLLILLSRLPFTTLKSLLDHLAADGDFERFSAHFYQAAQLPFLVAGSLSLLLGGLIGRKAAAVQHFIHLCFQKTEWILTRLPGDFRSLLADLSWTHIPVWERFLLLGLMAFAVMGRLLFIQRGVEYDEGYTYMEFARHSLWQVMSDYHVPNNHVFHTILVWAATHLGGNSLWVIRIPTFTAGVLIVLAAYLLGRTFYSPWVGLTAAGGLAAVPVMILYSTNARGYTLITLFTLLLFLLADRVRLKKNVAAWLLMVLLTALGFYTIPIMLYPAGIVFTWLLLAGRGKEIDLAYGGFRGWARCLSAYALGLGVLSFLFYLPIFQTNGILTMFNGNRVVNSLPLAAFIAQLPNRLADLQGDWLWGGLPAWVFALLFVGVVLSIFLQPKIGRRRTSLFAAALLFLVPFLILQRPFSVARIWLFMLPILVICGLGGWAALIRWPVQAPDWLEKGLLAGALVLIFIFGGSFLAPFWKNPASIHSLTSDGAALVTQTIKDQLKDGDAFVVSEDEDARYWYYFDDYHIPESHIRDIKRHYFNRVFVLSSINAKWTAEQIIEKFGPDEGFLKMETIRPVFQFGTSVVYQVDTKQDVVDRTFGIPPAHP